MTTQTITTFHASVSTDNMVTVQHGHGRFMTSDPTIWESTFHPPSFTDKEQELIYTSVQLQMQQQQQQGYASRQNLDPPKNPHEQYVKDGRHMVKKHLFRF